MLSNFGSKELETRKLSSVEAEQRRRDIKEYVSLQIDAPCDHDMHCSDAHHKNQNDIPNNLLQMSTKEDDIYYSPRYSDDTNEFRHVT